jgi:CBS domain-containing protein
MDDELFSRHYGMPRGRLFEALQQALATMPSVTLQRLDDTGRSVEFRTSFTLTSWGDNMVATVDEVDDGAVLRVAGRPRVGIMSTPWGEEAHATQIEQQLFTALGTILAAGAATEPASAGGDASASAPSSKRAREIMTSTVEVIDVDATVADAAVLLAAAEVGALPICSPERRLQGMLTDRDIVVKVVAQGKDPASTKVRELVEGTEVVTIGADDSLDEALRTMKDHKVRRLPVIDGTELVGIVSQGDLAQHLPEGKVGELLEVISAAPPD